MEAVTAIPDAVNSAETKPVSAAKGGFSLDKQPRYFEADGALRAMANRNFLVAIVAGLAAIIATSAFLFARFQPPTVIRVGASGEAAVISPGGTLGSTISPSSRQALAQIQEPSEFDRQHYTRSFLNQYLNYDQYSIGEHWSSAVNMMTGNLKMATLTAMQKQNLVGKYQDEHVRSVFTISSLKVSDTDPLSYHVDGVRDVTRFTGSQTEHKERLVEAYDVRLVETARSAANPSGLLVAEVNQNQITSESQDVKANNIDTDSQ